MDAAEKRRLEETLLRSAEKVVYQMRGEADAGHLDGLARLAEKIQELTKLKEFPRQRADEFQRSVKFIQKDAHSHHVADLLKDLIHRIHHGDEEAKKDLIGKIREHVALAVRFGADEDFRASVDRHLKVIEMTTEEGIDKRAKDAAKRRTELHDTVCRAPGGRERRRAIRYVDPVLVVEIGGVKYKTLNLTAS